MSRSTRYLLKKLGTSLRLVTKVYIQMCLKLANNVKVDFSKVLFTDENRATLDGSDG